MISDIELLIKFRQGDIDAEEELFGRYKPIVTAIARKYYLIGGDKEDLLQEGWLGFFRAMRQFDETKSDNFKQYATLLIEREMIDAIRRANSNKNQVLSSSVFVDNDEILSSDQTIEDEVFYYETYKDIFASIKSTLSDKEKKVLEYYLQGYNYVDISQILDTTPKSIDNTLTLCYLHIHSNTYNFQTIFLHCSTVPIAYNLQ